jgi:hypothetical protein
VQSGVLSRLPKPIIDKAVATGDAWAFVPIAVMDSKSIIQDAGSVQALGDRHLVAHFIAPRRWHAEPPSSNCGWELGTKTSLEKLPSNPRGSTFT